MRIAIDFGNSSPITTCKNVNDPIASPSDNGAIAACGNHATRLSSGCTSASTNGSPSHPSASEAIVIPSWFAER